MHVSVWVLIRRKLIRIISFPSLTWRWNSKIQALTSCVCIQWIISLTVFLINFELISVYSKKWKFYSLFCMWTPGFFSTIIEKTIISRGNYQNHSQWIAGAISFLPVFLFCPTGFCSFFFSCRIAVLITKILWYMIKTP